MPNSETTALATQLNSPFRKKRTAALDHIRAMPHDKAVETILELAQYSTFYRAATQLPVYLPLVVVLTTLILMCAPLPLPFNFWQSLGLKIVLNLYLMATCFVLVFALKRSSLWICPLLTEYRDTRLIQLALNLLADDGIARVRLLTRSLTDHLPSLTPELAATYTSQERLTLRNLLLRPEHELRLAVLDALTRIEDTAAIPNVERLLSREIAGDVRANAERCLERLKEVRAAERESKILLRPSQERGGSETLLRMSRETKSEDEAQLLRPGSGEE